MSPHRLLLFVWLLQEAVGSIVCPTTEADVQGLDVAEGARCCLSRLEKTHPQRMVVVAGVRGGTWWLEEVWPAAGYTVVSLHPDAAFDPDTSVLQRCQSGREAAAYVQWILDNWDCLPDTTWFIHGHELSPHFKYVLQLVRRGEGSPLPGGDPDVPVRMTDVFDRFCWDRVEGMAGGFWQLSPVPMVYPVRTLGPIVQGILRENWDMLKSGMQLTAESVPDRLSFHCCAEFGVSREAIRRPGLKWWRQVFGMMCDHNPEGRGDYWMGRVMEHLWDSVFGADLHAMAVHATDMFSCARNQTEVAAKPPAPASSLLRGLPLHMRRPVEDALPARVLVNCNLTAPGLRISTRNGALAPKDALCCGGVPPPRRGVIAAFEARHTQDYWFRSMAGMESVFSVAIPRLRSGGELQGLSTSEVAVCPRAGRVGAFLQAVVQQWDCLPTEHAVFTSRKYVGEVTMQGGGFPMPMTMSNLTNAFKPKATGFVRQLCFHQVTGCHSLSTRPRSSQPAGKLLAVMQAAWEKLKPLLPESHTGDVGDDMRFMYKPGLDAVVHVSRLAGLGKEVFQVALADLCRSTGRNLYHDSVVVEAYSRLWSVIISTSEERGRELSPEDIRRRFQCSNP